MTAAGEETNELRHATLRLYGTLFKYDLHKRVRGGGEENRRGKVTVNVCVVEAQSSAKRAVRLFTS